MAKNPKETAKQTRRTQVKDLPKEEKELSKPEQEGVKGGIGALGLIISSAKPQNPQQ